MERRRWCPGYGLAAFLALAVVACASTQSTPTVAAPSSCPEPVFVPREIQAVPTHCDAIVAMRTIAGAVAACGLGTQGTLNMAIVFHDTGRFASARVTNAPYAETPTARCAEQAASQARLPPFSSRPTFTITYPFVISP